MQKKSPLDSLMLSFSCPVLWDSMEGDERERLCRQCDKKVDLYTYKEGTKTVPIAFYKSNRHLFGHILSLAPAASDLDIAFKTKMMDVFPPVAK